MSSTLPIVVTGVDTHAHVFRADLPLVPGRRYSPDYDASVDSFLGHLNLHGVSHGVLVQPSFLGTDNSFMVAALRQHPSRLRGIAVVEPEIPDSELDQLADAGVVGIRLNLVGKALGGFTTKAWRQLFERIAARDWQVEIQRSAEDIAEIATPVLESGATVVIDHFGLPEDGNEKPAPMHHALLDLLAHGRIWMKLSAAYRSGMNLTRAGHVLKQIRSAGLEHDRWLWGSDWPHTRHESEQSYADQWRFLQQLIPDHAERSKVLIDNPSRLFRIDTAS
uniref:amidohydrolase family protein n=1 Tax=Halomonas sp. TaxID=1486246 RepID=UPI002621E180|nr:amidohydrolase family protein [Halomonas sp.]